MAASDSYTASCSDSQSPRFVWDGARCVVLSCSCTGSDCDALFTSVMSCYEERGACDPLASERAACILRYPNEPSDAAAAATNDCLADNGTNCDGAPFLSQAAAVCIARAEGLADGLEPWTAGLYFHGWGRVVWGVTSTTSRQVGGEAGGQSLVLDASTGFVLDNAFWQSIPGRPFVVEHAARTAEAISRSDYCAAAAVCLDDIVPRQRAALAAEWTRVGLLEHASVAAFARFALQLLGLGAPAELLEACQRAMQDELLHTRIAFGLASAYAGTPLGPGPLNLDRALDTPDHDLLAQVALTTLVEGCIGETLAALDAREGASSATDPHVRAALSTIARDEERHAELAWRFLDWALAQRPSLALPLLAHAGRARNASQLSAAGGSSPAMDSGGEARSEVTLLQHGILPLAQKRELAAQAFEQVIWPCLVALADKYAPASVQAGRLAAAALGAAALPGSMS